MKHNYIILLFRSEQYRFFLLFRIKLAYKRLWHGSLRFQQFLGNLYDVALAHSLGVEIGIGLCNDLPIAEFPRVPLGDKG